MLNSDPPAPSFLVFQIIISSDVSRQNSIPISCRLSRATWPVHRDLVMEYPKVINDFVSLQFCEGIRQDPYEGKLGLHISSIIARQDKNNE
jgi:hypothetical protein